MADPNTSSQFDAKINAQLVNQAFRSNDLFTAITKDVQIAGLTNLAQKYVVLEPKGGKKTIDIVGKFQWKNSGSVDEVPSIWAMEQSLDYGAWTQNLADTLQAIGVAGGVVNRKSVADPYLMMYNTTSTGFYYKFPWLLNNGDNIRNVNSSWGDAGGVGQVLKSAIGGFAGKGSSISQGIGEILGLGAKYVVGKSVTNIGFEQVNEFKKTEEQSITVTFPLYNTVDVKKAYDNFCFVNLFTFQNLKTRTSFMTYNPPKLYSIESGVVGGIYMPLAYVSNLKIDSIGTTRDISNYFNTGVQILIPEAYKVSITFTELLSQSTNIFLASLNGQKVTVSTGYTPPTRSVNNSGNGKISQTQPAFRYNRDTLNQPPPSPTPTQP